MGGKSRRNTAKTGDSSLYNNRVKQQQQQQQQQQSSSSAASHIVERHSNNNNSKRKPHGRSSFDKNDLIYDEVDQFHNNNNNDYLRFDHDMGDGNDDSDDDDGMMEEEVMRLDGDDDEDSETEADDDGDDADADGYGSKGEEEDDDDDDEEERVISSDDDEGDDDGDDDEAVRDWGIKKTAYYYGDTADLEIGQEEDDAILEADAAKDVLAARYQDMTDDDFMIDNDDENNDNDVEADQTTTTKLRNEQSLSTKEKRQILHQHHHGEFIPVLSYFAKTMILPYTTTTMKATNAIFYSTTLNDSERGSTEIENTAESIGATRLGQQYLLSKAMIQSSAMLNLVLYLLLKTEQAANAKDDVNNQNHMVDAGLIQSHPVMQHLEKLNSLYSKLQEGVEQNVDGLTDQLETLAKAADYLNDPTSLLDTDDDSDDDALEDNENDNGVDLNHVDDLHDMENDDMRNEEATPELDGEDNAEVDEDDNDMARRSTLNEARFGLRHNEILNLRRPTKATKVVGRRRNMIVSDAGDDDIVDDTLRKKAGQALATTLNTIEQRTNKKLSKRSTQQQLVEQIDGLNDEEGDGELRRGLDMMEEALGAPSDDDEEEENQGDAPYDPELDDYDNGKDDFYSKVAKKSKAIKDARKERYAVAPKYPRVDGDIAGDRLASKQILKNRGLVAHKAKINRNPRVKHREKFRKANIRRGGAVQAIRSPSEGYRYGGEVTGISTNVVRSRKLG